MDLEELWCLIRKIPKGSVCSYGDLGRALSHPASGFLVGRWMAMAPPDIPWWRVIAKSGQLPIGKRSPDLEQLQRQKLLSEGVVLEGDIVTISFFWYPD